MNTFTSPVPMSVDIGGLPAPPAGGPPAVVIQSVFPDIITAIISINALYDNSANPLIVSPIGPGSLFFVQNNESISVKVVGPTIGDPGVIVPPGQTFLIGTAPDVGGGRVFLAGGDSVGPNNFVVVPDPPFVVSTLRGYDIDLDPAFVTPVGGLVPLLIDQASSTVWGAVGAERASYIAQSPAMLNNPTLLLNGVTNLLRAASLLTLNYERTQPYTMYLVIQSQSANGYQPILDKGNPLATGFGAALGNGGSNAFLRVMATSVSPASEMVVDCAQPTFGITRLYTIVYDGLSRCSDVAVFSNGVRLTNNNTLDTLTSSILNGSFALLGSDGAGSFFGGEFGRAVICKAAHYTQERVPAETFFRNKYGAV